MGRKRRPAPVAAAGGVDDTPLADVTPTAAGETPSCEYTDGELEEIRQGKPGEDERFLATVDVLIAAWEYSENRVAVLETMLAAVLLKCKDRTILLNKLDVASVLHDDSVLVKKHANGMDWVVRLNERKDKTLDVKGTVVG